MSDSSPQQPPRPAEGPADRLREVQSIADTSLAHLGLEQLLEELLTRVTAILDVDTAAMLLLEEEGTLLGVRAAKGLEEEVRRQVRIPVGKGFAGRIAVERRAVVVDDVERAEILNPILREKGLRSLLGVPLLVEGELVGVMHVGSLTGRRFTTEDAELLQLAADRAAVAVRARLSEHDRAAVETLQRTLLPGRLPQLPGAALAARYQPAFSPSNLGGDWYDAFLLESGRIAVVIGDVVGHGLPAAALMGQLRNGLRAYAIEGASPGEVLEHLNRLMREIERGRTATLLYMVIDPETRMGQVASAGHPPPLLVDGDRGSAVIDVPPGLPLGAMHRTAYEDAVVGLGVGSTLVLYTDGLVERRGVRLQEGLVALEREIAARRSHSTQAICDGLLTAMIGGTEAADDAAVVAFRFEPMPDPMHVSLPAEPSSPTLARRLLGRWLAEAGVEGMAAEGFKLACSEACANAVEHAYPPSPAEFELQVGRAGEAIELTVRDSGRWRQPRGTNRGRGFLLMRAMVDDVQVEQSSGGTTVTLRHRVPDRELAS